MAAIDRTGQRYGRLLVLERAPRRPGSTNARWLCRCDCGGEVDVRSDSLTTGLTRSCGCLHRETGADRNRKDRPCYESAHQRLRNARGPAAEYDCTLCGSPAREWAYDGRDPDELTQQRGASTMTYSTNLNRYNPMCAPCHRAHDAALRQERK